MYEEVGPFADEAFDLPAVEPLSGSSLAQPS